MAIVSYISNSMLAYSIIVSDIAQTHLKVLPATIWASVHDTSTEVRHSTQERRTVMELMNTPRAELFEVAGGLPGGRQMESLWGWRSMSMGGPYTLKSVDS